MLHEYGKHWFLLIWISNLMLEIKIPLFVLHAMHMRIVKIKSEFDLSTICTYKETKNGWNKIFIFPDTSTILFEFCFWTICICNFYFLCIWKFIVEFRRKSSCKHATYIQNFINTAIILTYYQFFYLQIGHKLY